MKNVCSKPWLTLERVTARERPQPKPYPEAMPWNSLFIVFVLTEPLEFAQFNLVPLSSHCGVFCVTKLPHSEE